MLLEHRRRLFFRTGDLHARYNLAAASCIELTGFLAWLRSNECFELRQSDLALVPPGVSAVRKGLPSGQGMVGLKLLPATKTSQTLAVDVACAWHTGSGMQAGWWWTSLMECLRGLGLLDPDRYLFCDPTTHVQWSSSHYRKFHLFPLLRFFRDKDEYLAQFDESTEATSLAFVFNDFKLWKKSGDTHVQKKRPGCIRKALGIEIYWNGRWKKLVFRTEEMDKRYQLPSLEDRISLSYFCC